MDPCQTDDGALSRRVLNKGGRSRVPRGGEWWR
jgi:hypothetical protein